MVEGEGRGWGQLPASREEGSEVRELLVTVDCDPLREGGGREGGSVGGREGGRRRWWWLYIYVTKVSIKR